MYASWIIILELKDLFDHLITLKQLRAELELKFSTFRNVYIDILNIENNTFSLILQQNYH